MSDRIKCFWVEPSGRVQISTHYKDGRVEKLSYSKEEGERVWAQARGWARGEDVEHSGMAPLYTLPDGSEVKSNELPAGAMYHAAYLAEFPEYIGADGIALCVVLPNRHHWMVDSQASNCTRPQRSGDERKFTRTHYCWCRHGDPKSGHVHVDKNGDTCAAGAGSIQSGDYHGFLHDGHLVRC